MASLASFTQIRLHTDLECKTVPGATHVGIAKLIVVSCVIVIEGRVAARDAALEDVIAPRVWSRGHRTEPLIGRSSKRLVAPFDARTVINEKTDLGKRLRELIVV